MIKRTKADADLSNAIRERDGWTCQRCGREYDPESPKRAGLHAAHMFTRRTKATRLDPDNLLALCYGCHQYADSHPEEKQALFVAALGEERFEALAARAHGKRDRLSDLSGSER